MLADHGIAISMDGKGAWRDNVFVERLWRSVKYEEVYPRAYDSASDHRGHADDSGRQAQHFSIRALFVFKCRFGELKETQ